MFNNIFKNEKIQYLNLGIKPKVVEILPVQKKALFGTL